VVVFLEDALERTDGRRFKIDDFPSSVFPCSDRAGATGCVTVGARRPVFDDENALPAMAFLSAVIVEFARVISASGFACRTFASTSRIPAASAVFSLLMRTQSANRRLVSPGRYRNSAPARWGSAMTTWTPGT
jgi:hypothetical protein